LKGGLARLLVLIATTLLAATAAQGRGEPVFASPSDLPANTQIVNSASASWQDDRGNVYADVSNGVTVMIQGVSALTVTPKEQGCNPKLDGYPAGQNVTRTFVIANDSNLADAYRITSFSADKGQIVSLSFLEPSGSVPITVGSTVSSTVQPGATIAVQVVLNTAGIAAGTSFALHLTAQTTVSGTANGLQSDSGEQWLLAATPSSLAGPGAADTPIQKTVNQQITIQAQPSGTVTYAISVKNYGGSPATNAVLTDTIPGGLTADASSATVNGTAVTATLSGQTLTVPIGTIDAGATDVVAFNAHVADISTAGSSFVNVASLSADGISPISTSPASVLVGTADMIYDPTQNNKAIAGATVSLLDATGNLVKLSGSPAAQIRTAAAAPVRTMSANTQNPFVTGNDGTYGFSLQPSQIAAGGSTFYLTVSAPGYLNRRIQLQITPQNDALYTVIYTSKDGQPVARAGEYALTTSSVQLANVFGLFGNVPLFKSQMLTISKTANQSTAQPGDRLIYTIDVANPSGSTLGTAQIADTLPAGEVYAPGTARLDGKPLEPATAGRVLTWTLPPLAAGVKHELIYAAVVFPSVPAGTLLTNSATASAVINGTMVNVNASANADVDVVDGALTDRSIITGRVFLDVRRTGRFARGDRGLAGVRIYLEDGSSALSDAEGRFNFPAVRPGMHVLRLDATTLPGGVHADGRLYGNWTLQRLVHGVLDDGLMQDVEFALGGGP
jgi:uncharacterized repeat protein (TIGR01451 family)